MGLNYFSNNEFVKDVYEIEFCVYLRFFCIMTLGYNFIFYSEFKSGLLILLFIGLVLNILAIGIQESFMRDLNTGPILAYKIQHLLVPAIFFIYQQDRLTIIQKRLVIVSFILLFIEQFLFQKRLPIARIFLIILVLSYAYAFLKIYGSNLAMVLRAHLRNILIASIIIGAMSIIGLDLLQYGIATFDRFFLEGNFSETLESDDRWKIGEIIMLNLQESNQLLFGKGFGGVVYHDSFFLDIEDGIKYRSASEMGIPTIFLKGGFVLLLIIMTIVFKALKSYKYAKQNTFLFSCWSFLFVWTIFLYSEGFIVSINSLNDLILGYSIGVLLRISSIKTNWSNLFSSKT